jgi:restriction system protein
MVYVGDNQRQTTYDAPNRRKQWYARTVFFEQKAPSLPLMIKRRPNIPIPPYDDMLIPTVEAIKDLGGAGSTGEIFDQVVKNMNLSPEVLEVKNDTTGQSEVEYRLAWSRKYLQKFGLIRNTSNEIWSLSSPEIELSSVDPAQIIRRVRDLNTAKRSNETIEQHSEPSPIVTQHQTWQVQINQLLLDLSAPFFERLIKRVLHESGFLQVEVTGSPDDGVIEGFGIAKVNSFLTFHVLFHCKRFQGAITRSQILEFRGTMQGRADKGLFITTGTFTTEATKEASRDGAPPVDLIDGRALVQTLKDLRLGVKIELVESVTVDPTWFQTL